MTSFTQRREHEKCSATDANIMILHWHPVQRNALSGVRTRILKGLLTKKWSSAGRVDARIIPIPKSVPACKLKNDRQLIAVGNTSSKIAEILIVKYSLLL